MNPIEQATLRALEDVHAIVSEGAAVGFNPLEGDWADRLFRSQGASFDAIKAARTSLEAAKQEPLTDTAKEGACVASDGCPTELAVLQRFWRNTRNTIAAQKVAVKGRDSDWWRGYSAALHWISVEAFNAAAPSPGSGT